MAKELIACLSTFLQIPANKPVAFVRDGASVNTVAVRHVVDLLYPSSMDVVCASHSLNNIGNHFDTPTLDEFCQWWVSLFSRSHATKLAWKTRTGVSPKSHSATRWWSLWEVLEQLLKYLGDVQPFLEECESKPNACRRLLSILQNETAPDSCDMLRMELAATVDFGEPFVRKTYIIEGDGMLSVNAYTHLQEVATAAQDAVYSNFEALVKDIAPGDVGHQNQLKEHANGCVRPAIRYFLTKFNHEDSPLFANVLAYKAARLCCPLFVAKTNAVPALVDGLRAFPPLDKDGTIQQLKVELAAYKVAAADTQPGQDRLSWWRDQVQLPVRQNAARIVITVPPSSAAAERVFSLLEAATSSQQASTLTDHLEVELMLQYNRGRLGHEL